MWNRLILGKIILFWAYRYICILDFVLYEYSSFSSSQEFFLHFGTWQNHSKISSFQSYFGDQILVKIGTQQLSVFDPKISYCYSQCFCVIPDNFLYLCYARRVSQLLKIKLSYGNWSHDYVNDVNDGNWTHGYVNDGISGPDRYS